VGLPHEIARLVIEGGVQEEALVGEPERLARFTKSALTKGYELLAFRQSADGDSPFFESNWHEKTKDLTRKLLVAKPCVSSKVGDGWSVKDTNSGRKSQIPCK
jgi:hypothetical protein